MDGTVPDDRWLKAWTTRAKYMDAFNVTTFDGLPSTNNLGVIRELGNQVLEERQVVGVVVVAVEPGRRRDCTGYEGIICERKPCGSNATVTLRTQLAS